jgi:hypothetical protein
MNSNETNDQAQEILEALRKVQDTPELKAELARDPQSVINKLAVSGIARHAVALGIAAMVVAPAAPQRSLAWL